MEREIAAINEINELQKIYHKIQHIPSAYLVTDLICAGTLEM